MVLVIIVLLYIIIRRTSNYTENDFSSVFFELSSDSTYSTRLKAMSNFYNEKDENKISLSNIKILKPGEKVKYYYTKDKSIKFSLEPVSSDTKTEMTSFDFKPPSDDSYTYNINTVKINDRFKNRMVV
jgi:hypothetical protein